MSLSFFEATAHILGFKLPTVVWDSFNTKRTEEKVKVTLVSESPPELHSTEGVREITFSGLNLLSKR